MNIPALPSGLHPEDYDRIEAAVMETVRGRWFLLEYARRQRAAETERLARAIDRLENYVASRDDAFSAALAAAPEPGHDMARARRVAERARAFASALRERGLDDDACAEADELAAEFAIFAGEASGSEEDRTILVVSPTVEPEDETRFDAASLEAGEWDDAEPAPAMLELEPEILTPAEIATIDPRLAALSRLDHLSLDEKLVLFG